MYALVVNGVIEGQQRVPPRTALRLDGGGWVCPVTWTDEEAAECGWFPVDDSAVEPAFDPLVERVERSLVVVNDLPEMLYTVVALTTEEADLQVELADGRAERIAARNAIQDLRDYRQLASPTAAQTRAVVKLMARVMIRLIKDSFPD